MRSTSAPRCIGTAFDCRTQCGHVFRVLTRNGKPVAESGDTTLIDPRSRAEIAFVADNPGKWMLHCHVLEHQASGMMALVRVAG